MRIKPHTPQEEAHIRQQYLAKPVKVLVKVSFEAFKFATQEGAANVQIPQQFQNKSLIS